MSDLGSQATTPERDAQLLDVGKQCSDPTCLLVDFLPIKCEHCTQLFCAEHFLPTVHNCEKYDVTKHDRVAPSCPLCDTPVAIPPGEDPNVRMDRHLNSECPVANESGKPKAKATPTCRAPRCRKVLFAPIRCDSCQEQFCPAHRFPKDHPCHGLTPVASNSKGAALVKSVTGAATRAGAASAAAGRAAISRSTAAAGMGSKATHPSKPTTSDPTELKEAKQDIASKSTRGSLTNSKPFSATSRSIAPLIVPSSTPATITTHAPMISADDGHKSSQPSSPKPATTPPRAPLTLSFVPRPIFGVA